MSDSSVPGSGISLAVLVYQRLKRVNALPFVDVSISDWFCGSVLSVYDAGLMRGTSEATFDPEGPTTWEMVAIMLQRFHLRFEVDEDSADDADRWTSSAVDSEHSVIGWALDTGIFDILQPFDPTCSSKPISREEAVVVLVKYCEYAGIMANTASNFRDGEDEPVPVARVSQASSPQGVSQSSSPSEGEGVSQAPSPQGCSQT